MDACGSSPRGRGTRGIRRLDPRGQRFIPARAGNALNSTSNNGPSPVHPRAGGERVHDVAPQPDLFGSSPRGRGTPSVLGDAHDLTRFIPARAGNASAFRNRSAAVTVHPRAGGERTSEEAAAMGPHGSSPRGRGTRAALAG